MAIALATLLDNDPGKWGNYHFQQLQPYRAIFRGSSDTSGGVLTTVHTWGCSVKVERPNLIHMEGTMGEYCLVEKADHIMTVRINRPDRLNALHPAGKRRVRPGF